MITETTEDAKADAVASMRERAAEKEQEAVQNVEEDSNTWAKIQGKLDDLSQTVTVVGAEVEMQPVGTDASIEALEQANELDEDELDEIEAAARGDDDASIEDLAENSDDVTHIMNTIADMMDEFCSDPAMNRAKWGRIPLEFLVEAFEEWSERRLSSAEIERVNSFRDE